MKYCSYCDKEIDEEQKHLLMMTKKAGKILAFEPFHPECYEKLFRESVEIAKNK